MRSNEVIFRLIHHVFKYEHCIVFEILMRSRALEHITFPNAFVCDIVEGTGLHGKTVANILAELHTNGFVQKSTAIIENRRTTLWEMRPQSVHRMLNQRLVDMRNYLQCELAKEFFCVECNMYRSLQECFDVALQCPVDDRHHLIEKGGLSVEMQVILELIQDLERASAHRHAVL